MTAVPADRDGSRSRPARTRPAGPEAFGRAVHFDVGFHQRRDELRRRSRIVLTKRDDTRVRRLARAELHLRRALIAMLRRNNSRWRPAVSSSASGEISCCRTMSPIRHQPPGHGCGKLICALYSGRLAIGRLQFLRVDVERPDHACARTLGVKRRDVPVVGHAVERRDLPGGKAADLGFDAGDALGLQHRRHRAAKQHRLTPDQRIDVGIDRVGLGRNVRRAPLLPIW